METHETVRQMTQGQLKDIVATLVGAIPELTFDEAKRVVGNKGDLVVSVREAIERRAGRSSEAPTNKLVGPKAPTVSSFLFPPLQAIEAFESWIQKVLELERQCHFAFFGQESDLAHFEVTLKKY